VSARTRAPRSPKWGLFRFRIRALIAADDLPGRPSLTSLAPLAAARGASFFSRCRSPLDARAIAGSRVGSYPMRRAFDIAVVPARPHPGAALRPDCIEAEDAPHDDAVLQNVVIVVAPFAGWARNGCVLENQRGYGSATKPDDQRKEDCGRQNSSQDNLNKRVVD
jgi:hypothetical protein